MNHCTIYQRMDKYEQIHRTTDNARKQTSRYTLEDKQYIRGRCNCYDVVNVWSSQIFRRFSLQWHDPAVRVIMSLGTGHDFADNWLRRYAALPPRLALPQLQWRCPRAVVRKVTTETA